MTRNEDRATRPRKDTVKAVVSSIVLRCADLARSVDFYSRFGLDFVEERHDSGPTHFAAVAGEFLLELYPIRPTDGPNRTTQLGLVVDDLDLIMTDLDRESTGSGWQPGSDVARVVDPDGRTVRLHRTPPHLSQ